MGHVVAKVFSVDGKLLEDQSKDGSESCVLYALDDVWLVDRGCSRNFCYFVEGGGVEVLVFIH